MNGITQSGEDSKMKGPVPPPSSMTLLFMEEAAKVGVIGAVVAAALAMPDATKHFVHTQSKINPGRFGLAAAVAHSSPVIARAALSGIPSTTKAATLKNAAISQRGKVDEGVPDELFSENNKAVFKPLLVATILGSLDTAITQWHSNQRAWLYQAKLQPTFTAPKPRTLLQYYRTYTAGYLARSAKNISTIGAYVAQPRLKSAYSQMLPQSTHSDVIANQAAIFTSGFTFGAVSNLLDRGNKLQLSQMSPSTFQTPSLLSIGKRVVATEGMRALSRGLITSVFYTTFALQVVPIAERIANSVVPAMRQSSERRVGQFFQAADARDQQASQASNEKVIDLNLIFME